MDIESRMSVCYGSFRVRRNIRNFRQYPADFPRIPVHMVRIPVHMVPVHMVRLKDTLGAQNLMPTA